MRVRVRVRARVRDRIRFRVRVRARASRARPPALGVGVPAARLRASCYPWRCDAWRRAAVRVRVGLVSGFTKVSQVSMASTLLRIMYIILRLLKSCGRAITY